MPQHTNDKKENFQALHSSRAGTINIRPPNIEMSTSPNYTPQTQTFSAAPITVILTVILLLCFFIGFFSIYFCRCFMANVMNTLHIRNDPSGALAGSPAITLNPGLDPELKQSFPTFKYSTVKDFRREKYGLECAICLGEFEDEDLLRLLTVCYHVFHQECVDLWLDSHKTCPVCRGDLDVPRKSLDKSPVLLDTDSVHDHFRGLSNGSLEDAVSIDIKEDNNNDEEGRGESGAQASSTINTEVEEKGRTQGTVERFSRSHSTGHSIVRTREEEDRYTLRLLEHVKIKIIRGHNSAGSCITFGEFLSPTATRNGGFGEASAAGCS